LAEIFDWAAGLRCPCRVETLICTGESLAGDKNRPPNLRQLSGAAYHPWTRGGN
jgi:hypothetical protein